jgi:hypothetical protein
MKIDAWLKELKVPPEAYRVVVLLPLVHVAWADGKVQRAERDLIVRIANEQGLLEHGGREVLERWLAEPPPAQQIQTDLALLNELSRGSLAQRAAYDADDLQLLLAWCQDVADAAGGLLGLRSSRRDDEAKALHRIAAALDITDAKHWQAKLAR